MRISIFARLLLTVLDVREYASIFSNASSCITLFAGVISELKEVTLK